jgi:hypothetical protein
MELLRLLSVFAVLVLFIFLDGLFRRRAVLTISAAATVLLLFLAPPASADTFLHIPASAWDEINQLLVALILGAGALLWKWIDARSPLKNTQAEQIARDAFSALLDKGARFGLTQAQGLEKKVGNIDVGNPAVAAGANFIIAHAPDMAKTLGIDITTEDGRAQIVRSIAMRIGVMQGATVGRGAPVPIPLPPEINNAGVEKATGIPTSTDAPLPSSKNE